MARPLRVSVGIFTCLLQYFPQNRAILVQKLWVKIPIQCTYEMKIFTLSKRNMARTFTTPPPPPVPHPPYSIHPSKQHGSWVDLQNKEKLQKKQISFNRISIQNGSWIATYQFFKSKINIKIKFSNHFKSFSKANTDISYSYTVHFIKPYRNPV